MKTKILFYIFFGVIGLTACQDDDASIGEITAPTNVQISAIPVGVDANNPFGDGSGLVDVVVTANNAISYKIVPEVGETMVSPSGEEQLRFSIEGVNTYTITATAYGTGGASSTASTEVEVNANYIPPPELLEKLIGDGTKQWRIKQEKPCHFGLGPVGGQIPCEWYGAGPNEKAGVGMYDDRYIFGTDMSFTHITNNTNDDGGDDPSGTVFGRDGLISEIGTGGTVDGADVLNLPYDDYTGTFALFEVDGNETIGIGGTGFLGYYIGGNHQYQIFDREEPGEILLKSTDGNGDFDWWFILTSDDQDTGNDVPDYTNLIWSDEFDGTTLNTADWTYEIGNGDNGWGNNESQYYTDRTDNLTVADGNLKITAKRESFGGFDFTSSRIKTQDKFEFAYGRVEISAKLPGGGGVWPALWMLGANIDEVGWPNCGEIDIMEYIGNNPNVIYSTLHYPGNSGGNGVGNSTTITNAETEFHTYECIWSPAIINFYVDGNLFHSVENNVGIPFNDDFFLIFNVAMGGSFGGNIDANFMESSMEVDYVRVYQ